MMLLRCIYIYIKWIKNIMLIMLHIKPTLCIILIYIIIFMIYNNYFLTLHLLTVLLLTLLLLISLVLLLCFNILV